MTAEDEQVSIGSAIKAENDTVEEEKDCSQEKMVNYCKIKHQDPFKNTMAIS